MKKEIEKEEALQKVIEEQAEIIKQLQERLGLNDVEIVESEFVPEDRVYVIGNNIGEEALVGITKNLADSLEEAVSKGNNTGEEVLVITGYGEEGEIVSSDSIGFEEEGREPSITALKNNLLMLKEKFIFNKPENKKMYENVGKLLDKIISYVKEKGV